MFWLAQAQALAGEVKHVRKTFEQAIADTNDVVWLAEEVDPSNNALLGNVPQAFSHLGLVNGPEQSRRQRQGDILFIQLFLTGSNKAALSSGGMGHVGICFLALVAPSHRNADLPGRGDRLPSNTHSA